MAAVIPAEQQQDEVASGGEYDGARGRNDSDKHGGTLC